MDLFEIIKDVVKVADKIKNGTKGRADFKDVLGDLAEEFAKELLEDAVKDKIGHGYEQHADDEAKVRKLIKNDLIKCQHLLNMLQFYAETITLFDSRNRLTEEWELSRSERIMLRDVVEYAEDLELLIGRFKKKNKHRLNDFKEQVLIDINIKDDELDLDNPQ